MVMEGIEAVHDGIYGRQMLIGMFLGTWEDGVTLVSAASSLVLLIGLVGFAANLSTGQLDKLGRDMSMVHDTSGSEMEI